MIRKAISVFLETGIVTVLLLICLLADSLWSSSAGFWNVPVNEIASVFRDPKTQWMAVLCLAGYLALVFALEYRRQLDAWRRFANANVWLAAFVFLVLARYVCA